MGTNDKCGCDIEARVLVWYRGQTNPAYHLSGESLNYNGIRGQSMSKSIKSA